MYALKKDGTEIPVDISLAPFRTNKGMVFTAFIRDLSDRKRFEAQQKFLAETSTVLSEDLSIEKRLEKLAFLFTPFLADMCLIFLNRNGRFNPTFQLHCESQNTDALKDVAEYIFIRPETSLYQPNTKVKNLHPLHIDEVTDLFLHGLAYDEEHFKSLKQLSAKSFLFVPLIARERIAGVLILGMSCSDRQFSEADIGFITQAGSRIALALDNIELYNEARTATQAREDILSIVSHDLKNPLAAIKSSFQLIPHLLKNKEHDQIKTVMDSVKESADFMNRLITDILDFAKIDEGNLSVILKETNIHELCKAAIEMFRKRAADKGLSLIYTNEQKITGLCDPDRIKQVLFNLIGNAIKFTDKGSVELKVTEDETKIRFSISDTGRGISKEVITKLFEKFWQQKETAHMGTGLGLYIAKAIVKAHDGKLWVESEAGIGSEFLFEIPKKNRDGNGQKKTDTLMR